MENPLNQSSWVFPLLETAHLIAIFIALGAIAIVHLRLLGAVAVLGTPSQLWRQSMLWTHGGLTLVVFSGFGLFSLDPEVYLENPVFHAKMTFLVLSLIYYFTLVRRAAVQDRPAPVVAGIGLILFAAIPLCGVLLGYE